MFEAIREIDVMSGRDCICSLEARYTFNIVKGRAARTWANAADGFHPAEDDSVDVLKAHIRFHPSHQWQEVTGAAFDMVCADIPDEWFIQQATEEANA